MSYSQRTFFKHLRLYDFVLTNASLSVKKIVQLTISTPHVGQVLDKALVIDSAMSEIWYEEPDAQPIASPRKSKEIT